MQPSPTTDTNNITTADADDLATVMDLIQCLVVDGLHHGFFDYGIKSKIGPGKKRQLIISAGKTHQFTIAQDDIPPRRS